MYATNIGRTFLDAYNNKFGTHFTGRSFFEGEFIPLFFDHHKYMMTAGNSPLENPKISWEKMLKGVEPFETDEQRRSRITKIIAKIENEKPDASIAIGYGASENTAATTGQITNIKLPINKEDAYLSWIGSALGIGVAGGMTILFNNAELLLDIFEGWEYYREYLEKDPRLKGNQINTWNGHWLAHRYSPIYDKEDPILGLDPREPYLQDLYNLKTISWINVLLGIAKMYSLQNLMGYIYSIGQSNTTIGFIPFDLQDIQRPDDLYRKFFGDDAWTKNRNNVHKLYGTAIGFNQACKMGSIGVEAMEPKGLRDYMPNNDKTKKISYSENDDEQKIKLETYKIWLLAMLNNEQLWNISIDFANLLLQYEKGAGKAKTDRSNNVKTLLGSVTTKQFLQNLISIMEQDKENNAKYETMAKEVHFLPRENFSYFITLIKLQYASLNNKNN